MWTLDLLTRNQETARMEIIRVLGANEDGNTCVGTLMFSTAPMNLRPTLHPQVL
jgi:hypothetical protein